MGDIVTVHFSERDWTCPGIVTRPENPLKRDGTDVFVFNTHIFPLPIQVKRGLKHRDEAGGAGTFWFHRT